MQTKIIALVSIKIVEFNTQLIFFFSSHLENICSHLACACKYEWWMNKENTIQLKIITIQRIVHCFKCFIFLSTKSSEFRIQQWNYSESFVITIINFSSLHIFIVWLKFNKTWNAYTVSWDWNVGRKTKWEKNSVGRKMMRTPYDWLSIYCSNK